MSGSFDFRADPVRPSRLAQIVTQMTHFFGEDFFPPQDKLTLGAALHVLYCWLQGKVSFTRRQP